MKQFSQDFLEIGKYPIAELRPCMVISYMAAWCFKVNLMQRILDNVNKIQKKAKYLVRVAPLYQNIPVPTVTL